MSTITYCDKCKKKQGKDHAGWPSLEVTGFNLKIEGLKTMWTHFQLCPECAKMALPKIVKLLKNK